MVGDAPATVQPHRPTECTSTPFWSKEAAFWQEFCEKATDHLRSESYAAYGEKKLDEF